MRPTVLSLSFVVVVALAWSTSPTFAGPASELAEWMFRQGAKFAEDIAGKSPRELAVELEELSGKAGDDAVEQLIKRGGPGALKAVRELGDRAPDGVRLIAKFGEPGKFIVEQGKTAAVDAFREFGDGGVRVLIEQGATKGSQMLSVYGESLAETATRLAPESMARLRHWMPQVEKSSPEWRRVFGAKLKQGGDDFVVWVYKRWKEVAVTGGLTVAGITAYKIGDGLARSVPNAADDPWGWVTWWLPVIIIVGLIAAAWVARHTIAECIKARG